MKKTIAAILFAALLVSTLVPMSVFASSPEGETEAYYDDLVGYWNFDVESPLVNKGTAETLGADLAITDTDTADTVTTTTADSKVTIPYAKGNLLSVAVEKGSALDTSTGMTIGFKICISDFQSGGYSTYLFYRANCYSLQVNKATNGYKLRYFSEATSSDGTYVDLCSGNIFAYDTEYYVFFTVNRHTTTQSKFVSYYSTVTSEVAADFTTGAIKTLTIPSASAEDTTLASNEIFKSMSKPIYIGKSGPNTNPALGNITLDDLWIFNTVLDANAIANVANGKVNNTTTATSDVPTYRGCQVSGITSGTFSTRFIATIDSLEYAEVGFMIQVTDYNEQVGDVVKYDTTTVYNSIVGSYENKTLSYSAAELGGKYVYALSVDNIYTNYAVTFKVTPYYITAAGEEPELCTPYSVTVNNGTVVSQTVIG